MMGRCPLLTLLCAFAAAAAVLLSTAAPVEAQEDMEAIKWQRQIDYVQALIDNESSVPLHYIRLAQAYAQLGQEDMVLRYTQEALDRGGNPLSAQILLGDFYADRGMYEEALSRYSQVLLVAPTQSYTLTKVWMLVQRSRTDRIGLPSQNTSGLVKTLNNAGFHISQTPPANNPAAAAARLREGNRLLNNNDVEGAVRVYKEAAVQDPLNPDIYRGLGIAYARTSDKVRAVGAYQLYIALAPPNRADLPKVRQIIIDFYVNSSN